jgi:hypothetical protein
MAMLHGLADEVSGSLCCDSLEFRELEGIVVVGDPVGACEARPVLVLSGNQ